MKKILITAFILFLVPSVFSAVPRNSRGEQLVIEYEEESDYSLLHKALKEEVDLEWYENYTSADSLLISSSFSRLSELLPLDNFVFSEEKNDAISVLDLTDGIYISFTFRDGKIHAISFS